MSRLEVSGAVLAASDRVRDTVDGLRHGCVQLGPLRFYTERAARELMAETFRLGVECGRLPDRPNPRKRRHLTAVR